MSESYLVIALTADEEERLRRVYGDLMALASSEVPSVRASARAAVAHIAQAMNGEGMAYDLYTSRLGQ